VGAVCGIGFGYFMKKGVENDVKNNRTKQNQ